VAVLVVLAVVVLMLDCHEVERGMGHAREI
jgi:hypothetical protein